MGDRNQLLFVQSHAQLVKGPILEVGSKDYGTTQDFRSLFPGEEYIGTDMFPGKGVDIVLDLTEDFERIDRALQGKRFNTIICMSVLEHCSDPFRMARNIESLLTEEGVLLLGVPFVWKIHGYPDDYWRFTPNGVKRLFPGLDFETHAGSAWTSRDGESGKLDDQLFRIRFSSRAKGNRLGLVAGSFTALCRKVGLLRAVFGYRYVFPPVMLSMVGKKRRLDLNQAG